MFLSPMLLGGFEEPFDDHEFIFEPKIDGCRLIYSQINSISHLYSRFHHKVTHLFPELYHIGKDDDIVLDGIVAMVNPESGRIDINGIKQRLSLRSFTEIQKQSIHNPCQYIIFDLLYYKGRDLRGISLMKRREILRKLDFGNRNIGFIPFIENNGNRLFQEIRERGMGGIVAKRKDSLYIGDRSDEWLQIVNWHYEDVYVTGYHTQNFGIRISFREHDGFKQAGIVTNGLTIIDQLTLLTVCKDLVIKEGANAVSLKPAIKARIKFRGYTKEGTIKNACFISFII
ncbi:MAG: ligB3 [Paenibacillus sp.]|jgi:DNA ligase-1|nr:ligB3 [Paenibacillus sp.]